MACGFGGKCPRTVLLCVFLLTPTSQPNDMLSGLCRQVLSGVASNKVPADGEIRVTTSHGPPCTQGWERISAVLCGRSPPPFLSALGRHRPMSQSMPGHCAGGRGQGGFGGPLGSSPEMDLEEPVPAVAPRRGQRRGRFGAVCRGISVRGDLDVVVTVKAFGGERPLPGASGRPHLSGSGSRAASDPGPGTVGHVPSSLESRCPSQQQHKSLVLAQPCRKWSRPCDS